ncbi:MAG: hypothetical protein Q8K75_03230 [Chlamydiales bacterium]|nr:hypothetical protein [Chlamydiales bacterium]
MDYLKDINIVSPNNSCYVLPSMQCLQTFIFLGDVAKAIEQKDTTNIQVELEALADEIILASNPERRERLRTIQNFPNNLVRQRACFALLRALCHHKEVVNGSEIIREMEETVIPTVEHLDWSALVSTWGSESMVKLASYLLPLNVDNNLCSLKCRALCQQLGSALFEWGSELHGSLMPSIKKLIFPSDACLTRIKSAMQKLNLDGDDIHNAKDFDDRIRSIVGDLVPSADEGFDPALLQNIIRARNAMKNGLRLLSPELLQIGIYDKVHPLAKCMLIDLIREFALCEITTLLLDRNMSKCFNKFCAYYLMDSFDEVLQKTYAGGTVGSVANYMFRGIARRTLSLMNTMNDDMKSFLKRIGEGQYCSEAVMAAGAFSGLNCYKDISDKFFSEMQHLVINNRTDVDGVMPIELGWKDSEVGHVIWAMLQEDGRVRVINTGQGMETHHNRCLSLNGAGNIYQLSRVSRIFDQTDLRNYLIGTTNLLQCGRLADLSRQINGTDEKTSKLAVALNLHYGSLGEGQDDEGEIYTKGQGSITCTVEALKGVMRSFNPPDYNTFHIVSKMMVFAVGYNQIKRDGHSIEYQVSLKRTLAKELFYQMEGVSKPAHLLKEIALHLRSDLSWQWDCPQTNKAVYSCYLMEKNYQDAQEWLDHLFKENDLLGVQCTAETMDGFTCKELPIEAVARSLEVLMNRMVLDPVRAYKSLEERSTKLDQFPWQDLVDYRRDLAIRLLNQMGPSGNCLAAQAALYNSLQLV